MPDSSGWGSPATGTSRFLRRSSRLVELRLETLLDPAPSRWDVVAVGRGASAPEQPHEIRVCGGGPTNGVPKAYLEELSRLLDVVAGDTWRGWWAESPVKLAEVFYWFAGSKPGVRVCVGTKVTGSIERPVALMKGANPVVLERADVAALTQRLTARLKLPEPPSLV